MTSRSIPLLALVLVASSLAQPTPPPGANPLQRGTTPGAQNDTSLRELTPEEIYPNLNFYAVNPLYREGRTDPRARSLHE